MNGRFSQRHHAIGTINSNFQNGFVKY